MIEIIVSLLFGLCIGWLLGKSSHEKALEDAYEDGRKNESALIYEQWRDGKGRFAKKPEVAP